MSSPEFHTLKVQLEDITSATNNFDPENQIGHGGFGMVYKGELSLPKGPIMIAFKRLDPKFGQGNNEFWKEINLLSKYRHENLVSLVCYCDEGHERILGYEFASRGSLDRYLSDTDTLTWIQRIKICIDVAHGLNYLHDPKETQERVLHRDIKSSNILLDEEWSAKLSDFGLSKFGPANQPITYQHTYAVGTAGYLDPLYFSLGYLTKESDVYSFGVVLFEIMCARLCYGNNQNLRWKLSYDENRLDDIVCSNLKGQMEPDSLTTFSAIAGQCLNANRKERPLMSEILQELEIALEHQKFPKSRRHLIELGKLAEPPLSYKSQQELLSLLSKGFCYKDTTWLSVTKNERVCEMISARKCITDCSTESFQVIQTEDSRFDYVIKDEGDFTVEVTSQFLEPYVTYTINLIYKATEWHHQTCAPFQCRLDNTIYCGPCISEPREDGWLDTQLYQFTCHQREQHFSNKCLCLKSTGHYLLQGIEFRPVQYERKERNGMNIRSVSSSDTDWEQCMPAYYMDLIKLSKETIQCTTNKELYLILRQGFLVDNGEMWFSITKSTKKRIMIPASAFLTKSKWSWKPDPESRFQKVAVAPHDRWMFRVKCEVSSEDLISPETTYSCHLIYKTPEIQSSHENQFLRVGSYLGVYECPWFIYLNPPHTYEKTPISSDTDKIKGLPKLRKDGWMEFQFWKVSASTAGIILMSLKLSSKMYLPGLVVQGIEFRPL